MCTISLRHAGDDALVAALRAGDSEAFTEIHRRYSAPLERFAARYVDGPIPGPEDIVQEVFARAHRALRGDDRPVVLRPWLYRLVRNRAIDELRRTIATDVPADYDLPSPELDPLAIVLGRQRTRQVLGALAALPDRQRDALVSSALHGTSVRELAASFGTTEKAVKGLTHRARTTIHRHGAAGA